LGSGKEWGAHFSYEIQEGSGGTAAALMLAERYVKDDSFMVILGDNVVVEELSMGVKAFEKQNLLQAKMFLAKVKDPSKYGVVTLKNKKIVSIVEKPTRPQSSYVNTGLWMFKKDVFTRLRSLKKSARGEYEVTDVLAQYAKEGLLDYSILKKPWTDAGSFESLYSATMLMRQLEKA
jgi:glucose-1-phosphate thymidylyltransferase